MLSRPSTYAIRALTYLAIQPPGRLCGSREIADHEQIPNSYVCKILLELRRKRLLRSYKGIGGGYELALPADKISLLMVVRSMEGELALTECILEDRECSTHGQCSLHESWSDLRNQLLHFLETQTVADLARTKMTRSGELSVGQAKARPDQADQKDFLSINCRS
jgi:Rrf2 family iron-sulfur cluster assembly transcriptional regulator